MTANNFIMQPQLDLARFPRVSTERKVPDIALDSDFGSLSRFYEPSSRSVGMTASSFRKIAREPAP